MKAVLASLKPYYYYLVGEGIKKIEVRKSQPKADDWNKETYFYMSKDEKSFAMIPKEFQEKYRKHFGKVGLRFVCDRIEEVHEWELTPSKTYYELEKERLDLFLKYCCLSYDEICEYRKNLPYFKPLYCWHISNLVIYDEPKELSEFKHCCPTTDGCKQCKYLEVEYNGYFCECNLTRPPMSWCYIEEKE